MGGDAQVTSEIGRGSAFTLTLRASVSVEPAKTIAASPPTPDNAREALRQSNLRVLVVDDNTINRRVASLFLAPLKAHIVEAANGLEALSALDREEFDLVLLDMHMPVMDGPTTIQRIRSSSKRWASILVVALTADAMSGDRERYLAMGINGYLSKPLSERDLLLEIARVRDGASPALARAS
jgi:CheY-like chemotaxis protein